MSQRLHSNTTYEYNCPVGARNDRLSAWFWTIRMCLHMIAVACVYNLYTEQYSCINACAKIIPSHIYCLSYAIPHVMIMLYIVYLILCKFSAPFGLSTCCIVVLSNYLSLINLATVLHTTIIYYCSISTARGSAL